MRTYNIKIVSQRNAGILIVVMLGVFLGGGELFFPTTTSQSSAIIVTATAFIVTYLLWQRFVIGRTQWTINDSGVTMTWTKQFSFTHKENINLKWEEIESISDRGDRNYHTLKIKLTSGKKIKFYHDTLTTRDDFEEFEQIFMKTLADKKK